MSRRTVAGNENTRGAWRRQARYVLLWLGIVAVMVLAAFAYYRGRQFLVSDARFRLAGPSESGEARPGVRVEGAVHCSVEKVLRAFSPDYGRSIFLIPLWQRRLELLDIDWVKDASISRQWPDRLVVRIVERAPVAFVKIPAPGEERSFEAALIDTDGVILGPPVPAGFRLPVLAGIHREQSLRMRRDRIQAALRLVREAAEMSDRIAEIDVLDPEGLKVTMPLEGRAIVLIVGKQNYLPRLRNFLSHYQEIRRRLPKATTFDLRLDDRITAIEEAAASG